MIVVRGLCAGTAVLIFSMLVVAFLDWGWVLTERTRWALSLGAYFVTGMAVWWTCLRKVVHRPAREEVAAQVEEVQPELRENLLSAVELATDNPAAVHDSPVFRGLLQGRVAQQMAKVQVARLLPIRLVMKWVVAALVVVAVIAWMLSGNDPGLRTLAARAILPGANIDRVSRIHVEILEPTPQSLMVAKDETVAVVVDVSGGTVDEAVLETLVPGREIQQHAMRNRTSSEYAANLHVDADEIQYRILAGDAVTRWHTINGKNRPRVVAFHKHFRFPEYAQLPEQTLTEDHGDLIVLQGTETVLDLDLDQPVSRAELRVDVTDNRDREVTAIPLTQNAAGQWTASVPVDRNAIYKVHLVSAETGFENIFSPRYEIRPVADLIPRAGFVDQEETNLLLPPNDILALKGMAEDDLPLNQLTQEISINGREWQSVPLEAVPQDETSSSKGGTERNVAGLSAGQFRIASEWNWDLLGLKLKTGDHVTTRVVAIDRKGNRGESVPLRIVVSAPDFDPDRHAAMQKKASLMRPILQLAELAKEKKATADEIIDRLQQDQKNDQKNAATARSEADQALDRTTLRDMAADLSVSAAALLSQVQDAERAMPNGADAYDLELTGRLIGRIQKEHPALADCALQVLTLETEPKGFVRGWTSSSMHSIALQMTLRAADITTVI
ncbi:MAG: hypothetical protein R3C49_09385 [Planctomycetaceae bacterium]